jgi:hypothetical protein
MDKIKLAAVVVIAVIVGYAIPHSPSLEKAESGREVHFRKYSAAPVAPSPVKPASPVAVPTPSRSAEFEDLFEQPSIFAMLHLAYDMAAESDQERLQRLALEALQQNDPLFRLNIADVFLEKMTADDPEQALTFAERLPEGQERVYMISSVLSSWVRRDEDAVLAYLQSITNMELKQAVAMNFLRDSTRSEAFLAAVQDELGPYGKQMVQSLRLSREAPADAFHAALQAPPNRRGNQLIVAGIRWFRQNPEAALAEISALAPSQKRTMLLQSMLGDLATRDPEQAMELLALYAPDDNSVQQLVLHRFAESNPQAALPYVEAYTQRTGDTNALSQLLGSWVRSDPEAAVEYAGSLPQHQQERALNNMAMNYVRERPREGLQWALSLSGSNQMLAQSAFHNLTPEAADIAESMLDGTPDGEARSSLIQGVAGYKTRQDPEAALRWLEQYQDDPQYRQTYANTLHNWANQNPVAASAQLEQRWDESELADSFRLVARIWSQRDPEAAINWASSLPNSPGREAAMASMVEVTAQRDIGRARALYETLPPGESRNRAAVMLANAMGGGDRERMREAMVDLGVSEDTINSYIKVWYR